MAHRSSPQKTGFVKVVADPSSSSHSSSQLVSPSAEPSTALTTEERSRLNRIGNQFLNSEKYEEACRVFQTTGYSDGLIRIADHYLQDAQPIKALQLYRMANSDKASILIARSAKILHTFLEEDSKINRERDDSTP